MAKIDLLNIQPTTVSRDLKSKYLLIYGKEKIGKTTFACGVDGALLLATEKGYNALSGVYAQDIQSWADFKIVLRQLKKPEIQSKFKTIVIDTFTILYNLCEKFICANNGVSTISEIAWGGGYAQLGNELSSAMREITMDGYGLVLIAHAKKREEKIDEDKTAVYYEPDIPKRGMTIANQLVDIIGFATEKWNNDGTSERVLVTRGTPYITAGSRFPKLPAEIPFTYHAVVNALADAIEQQGDTDTIVDEAPVIEKDDALDYDKIRNEASAVWKELIEKQKTNAEKEAVAEKVLTYVEKTLGKKKKLSEITPREVESFAIILDYMKEL